MRIGSLLNLSPGMSVCEIGGGNGTFFREVGSLVMPGGKLLGTGKSPGEKEAMRAAAMAASFAEDDVSVFQAQDRAAGLPDASCDAIYLRMVYHMLAEPKHYLASFRAALKPGGRMLILEHNPDNGVKTRDGAKLTVQMGKMKMDMKVVPQEAMVSEAAAGGWKTIEGPFDWPYFQGPHGVDERGYALVLALDEPA